MGLNFYPDSNFFERLTKRGKEHHWNEFIDECKIHNIEIPNGYDPIFTSFLLLERLGLGGVLKPQQEGPAYKSLVRLLHAYVQAMPDPKKLNIVDLKRYQQEIADLLDGISQIFRSLLELLPELKIDSFLKRFDEEIAVYATSTAAGELIQPTLKRLRECFTKDSKNCLSVLMGHLVWNLIATFPYIEPDQISKEEASVMFEKAVMWFDALFASFHEGFTKGINIGFFRLAENRHYTYSKIVAKDSNNPLFTQAKTWLERYKPLRRKDDLCDGELIDFSILGLEGKKVFCFTSDSHVDIVNRLGLLKETLDAMSKVVEGWAINPCMGRTYCVSDRGQSLKIIHSFLLDKAMPKLAMAPSVPG